MAVELSCNGCGKRLRVPDRLAGKKVKCPTCGTIVGGAVAPVAIDADAYDVAPPPLPQDDWMSALESAAGPSTPSFGATTSASRRSTARRARGGLFEPAPEGGDAGIFSILQLGMGALLVWHAVLVGVATDGVVPTKIGQGALSMFVVLLAALPTMLAARLGPLVGRFRPVETFFGKMFVVFGLPLTLVVITADLTAGSDPATRSGWFGLVAVVGMATPLLLVWLFLRVGFLRALLTWGIAISANVAIILVLVVIGIGLTVSRHKKSGDSYSPLNSDSVSSDQNFAGDPRRGAALVTSSDLLAHACTQGDADKLRAAAGLWTLGTTTVEIGRGGVIILRTAGVEHFRFDAWSIVDGKVLADGRQAGQPTDKIGIVFIIIAAADNSLTLQLEQGTVVYTRAGSDDGLASATPRVPRPAAPRTAPPISLPTIPPATPPQSSTPPTASVTFDGPSIFIGSPAKLAQPLVINKRPSLHGLSDADKTLVRALVGSWVHATSHLNFTRDGRVRVKEAGRETIYTCWLVARGDLYVSTDRAAAEGLMQDHACTKLGTLATNGDDGVSFHTFTRETALKKEPSPDDLAPGVVDDDAPEAEKPADAVAETPKVEETKPAVPPAVVVVPKPETPKVDLPKPEPVAPAFKKDIASHCTTEADKLLGKKLTGRWSGTANMSGMNVVFALIFEADGKMTYIRSSRTITSTTWTLNAASLAATPDEDPTAAATTIGLIKSIADGKLTVETRLGTVTLAKE